MVDLMNNLKAYSDAFYNGDSCYITFFGDGTGTVHAPHDESIFDFDSLQECNQILEQMLFMDAVNDENVFENRYHWVECDGRYDIHSAYCRILATVNTIKEAAAITAELNR